MGNSFAEVGLYFHPLSTGTLSVSAAPIFSFEWWTDVPQRPVRLHRRIDRRRAAERDLLYVIFVSASAGVIGAGWPGNLAGATLSAAVPSITWTFNPAVVATF
jgi:hypothetical protein